MTEKRTAIVTGGGSGMGRAMVHRLARDGFKVANVELNAESADMVAKEVREEGNEAVAFGDVDVSDLQQVNDVVQRVRETMGPILVLVNNAGITAYKDFLAITNEKWDRVMAVNVNGPFYLTQAVIPDMLEAGWGRIVNISSSSAHAGQSHMVHYVTSKAALIGMTKALAKEYGPHGITVNTIPPGFIDTPMLRESERRGLLGESVDYYAAQRPVRRAGTPEDIAAACSFLCSDEASYITGQMIGVNGGANSGYY